MMTMTMMIVVVVVVTAYTCDWLTCHSQSLADTQLVQLLPRLSLSRDLINQLRLHSWPGRVYWLLLPELGRLMWSPSSS